MTLSPNKYSGRLCSKHPELDGLRYIKGNKCLGCNRENIIKIRKANRKRAREYVTASTSRAKREVFEHYGGCECKLCGFDNMDALSLDHVDGGGGKLRKNKDHPWGGYALYSWLRKNNYPAELKFRVLCFNCNAIESVDRLRKERREKAEQAWEKNQ